MKLFLLFMFIAPPSFNMVYDSIKVALQRDDSMWVSVEAEKETLENVFDFAYKEAIILNIRPESILFDIKPYSSDGFMKAYGYAEQLMKAL